MRYLLPVAAAAAALSVGLAPAAANSQTKDDQHHQERRHEPRRAKAHVTLHLSGHTVLAGNGIGVTGKVRPSGRHRVRIVFRGRESGFRGVTTKANGSFSLRWTPKQTGTYSVRAFGVHEPKLSASTSVQRHLTSYRFAGASYYGPGLYGNGVACGGTLTPDTLGVAHKTLPCGTKVKLSYHGRTITVPVIDRGPYVAGRDYDLTEATRDRLGFPGVDTLLATR
jgi:peptidoglycan lytic transglycosylase